ncbi:uncharacterized protein LOC115980140 [Quercus lobata]|uniref:uncharacterized protein LOC115980140 n=1 Tax=Quercus lobata TaxID=97700 RepID=UPI00124813A8|nr:uncharacterized protein LOC115980140 [Quercus lobata]
MAPLLSPSVEGEELYLYLAVTPHAVSSALIREEDKVQRPVYYTSKALKGAEGRYPQMEKLAFALITASRKLRHYFQAHVINVMTDHPLKKAMNRPEAAGRLIQWAVELSEFDIRYLPRHAIKAQALADFIAEFTPSHNETEDSKRWIVHVDGSSTRHAGGIGVVLQSPEGDKLKHKVRLQYQATNNEVEYEALLKGLELAKSVEAKSICVMGDSQLIMGQVNGTYEAKEERMKKYLGRVMRLVKRFEKADFVQIPREENVEADTIAKEASADESLEKSDEVQYVPSIDAQEVQQVDNKENWMTPIISYLKDGQLPEEKDEARKVRVRSARYVLMNGVLYKRVPAIQQRPQATIGIPHPNGGTVALRTMGTGHFGSLPFGSKADEVSSGGHRLLHQMGGGRTVGKYHATECEKLRVEEHRMQIWSAEGIGV